MTEESFLESLLGHHVNIYLQNGVRLQGILEYFNTNVIILDRQLIYKSQIATVVDKEVYQQSSR